jgi:tryptophan synthase beta subunit
VARRKKIEYQDLSDFAAVYGLGRELGYDGFVGLLLNLDRQRLRQEWSIAAGLDMHEKGPSFEACRAVRETDEEAADLFDEIKNERGLQCRLQNLTGSRSSSATRS